MERLVAMMAFCEAPLDGTLAPSGATSGAAATGGGGNVVALLDAAAKQLPPVERLAASMAFCEAPLDGTFDGTSAPSSVHSVAAGAGYYYGASATGGGNVVPSLHAAARQFPVERLVSSMALCEAPLDGIAISAPLSSGGAAEGGSASAANVPEPAVARRRR